MRSTGTARAQRQWPHPWSRAGPIVLSWVLAWGSGLGPVARLEAASLPSLFRGVVVSDSSLGVRVVSVDPDSQASRADLRPEDVIVRVRDTEVRSIDDFSVISNALRGRAVSAAVLVFRHGAPKELLLHLFSYPVLQAWGVEFVADDDIRFAEPRVGRDYWRRLGRGFEEAGKPEEALNAYLNSLHNVPEDLETAVAAQALYLQLAQQRFTTERVAEGVEDFQHALVMMERLFERDVPTEQLTQVKIALERTLVALRQATAAQRAGTPAPSPRPAPP